MEVGPISQKIWKKNQIQVPSPSSPTISHFQNMLDLAQPLCSLGSNKYLMSMVRHVRHSGKSRQNWAKCHKEKHAMQNLNVGNFTHFFQFIDFCQLWYAYHPYFHKLLWKNGINIVVKLFKTGSHCGGQSVILVSHYLFVGHLHKCKV